MKPVIPFEPVSTEKIPTGSQWVSQVKWDGVRVLTYFNGNQVKLYNRKLNERTFHYPELLELNNYCLCTSVILDGEIIALKDGKPSFYEVMKRDGITNLGKVKKLVKTNPIIYMIFDILYYNGSWVISKPLSFRQALLEEIINPNHSVQLVENFADSQALFDVISQNKMEGIVIKDLNSTYGINGKDSRWQKKKYYQDVIAVVGGITFRGNIVNSLLIGLYDKEGALWYIGHVGTGRLTQDDWRNLTKSIQPIITTQNPFLNPVPRLKEAIWLEP